MTSSLEQLAAFWSEPVPARGAALRALLGHTYAEALRSRWSHGGYGFVFLRERRERPAEAPPPAGLVERMLSTAFLPSSGTFPLHDAGERELEPLDRSAPVNLPPAAWGTVDAALSTWLDEWLLFRRSGAWVRQDDVPPSMEHTLTRPWQRCVGQLVNGARWAAATSFVAEGSVFRRGLDAWGDHGTALVVATTAEVHVLQVGLWT
ncbi:hypothetical protein, partial [Marinitenerispora sediminis]